MITVVSGLPRSGTSLLMQMLAAGGMPLLTDPNALPGNTQTYLQSVRTTVTQAFVYGGTAAVATPVVASINTAIT